MPSIAGFVLTGGMSTRMRRDKALLPFAGQTLCEYLADMLSAHCRPVFLVGHPERYRHLKYECIPDRTPNLGPLSGLDAALHALHADLYLLLACDFVNVKPAWLTDLLVKASQTENCVVLQDAAGKLQPLCGVYRNESRSIVSSALAARRLRMMDLLSELGAETVPVDEPALNINTPEDYADYRRTQSLH